MFVLAVLWASDVCMWDLPDLFGFVIFENFTDIWAPFFLLIISLTSNTAKKILETRFMKFLGWSSFMMYLIHPLIFGGFMADFYIYLVWNKMDPVLANHISFLVFTPILFGVSYFLTIFVDIPAKDFAFEMDLYFRDARPKKGDADYYSGFKFWMRSPKILMILGWLVFVYFITKIIPFDNDAKETRCIDFWLYPGSNEGAAKELGC